MHLGVILSMKSGIEHFVYREVCELAARGASITLFPCKQGRGLYRPHPEWNCRAWRIWQVLLCQPLRFLAMPARYLAVLWEAMLAGAIVDFLLAAYFVPWMRSVDVIHATFGDRKLFIGYFCKRLTGNPLAVTIHAYELYRNPNSRLFQKALAACDEIMTVSEYNRDLLAKQHGIPAERIRVSRLSIDLEEYQPTNKFIVLIVAFFVEKKGHDILFEAIKRLGCDDIEVWVVGGSGGSSSEVDVPVLVKQAGLEGQVAFFGKLSGTALKAVYHACDVFCLPSRFDRFGEGEGFPTVIIEAMACGKPVVTTAHVEIPRIVEQIVVPENDAAALADALDRVYRSRPLRQQLGERNRELAEEYFSSRNLEEKLAIFRQLAGKNSPTKTIAEKQPTTPVRELHAVSVTEEPVL